MVRLKSRTQCPVGGFQFTQPEIGWTNTTWDFEQMARELQAVRAANPRFNLSTDMNIIRQQVDEQNALRMLSIRGADSYIVTEGGPSPNRAASLSQNWRNAAGGIKRVVAGATLLRDWLGEGGVPVANELAASRAAVCRICPQNQGGDWLSKFTQPASELIRSQLSVRKDLSLTTPSDDKLEFCEACSCPLKLKVHVPLKFIAEHQTDDVKNRLDAGCWILKELAA